MTTVLATLKSTKHVVRVILRTSSETEPRIAADAADFPFEVQVLSCGRAGRYSYVNAFADEADALRQAAAKFASLA